jgi:hypothetical protein
MVGLIPHVWWLDTQPYLLHLIETWVQYSKNKNDIFRFALPTYVPNPF